MPENRTQATGRSTSHRRRNNLWIWKKRSRFLCDQHSPNFQRNKQERKKASTKLTINANTHVPSTECSLGIKSSSHEVWLEQMQKGRRSTRKAFGGPKKPKRTCPHQIRNDFYACAVYWSIRKFIAQILGNTRKYLPEIKSRGAAVIGPWLSYDHVTCNKY